MYGIFAFGAAIGTLLLGVRIRHHRLVWMAVALSWAGTGAMCAWGSWLLRTALANAPDAWGYQCVLLLEVLASITLAYLAVHVLFQRQAGAPAEGP